MTNDALRAAAERVGREADLTLVLLFGSAARDGVALYEGEPGAHARFASLALRRFFDTQKFRDAERDYVRALIAETAATDGTGAP